MSQIPDDLAAQDLARKVFDRGRQALLSHAVRATEAIAFEEHTSGDKKAPPFAIAITVKKNVQAYNPGRPRAIIYLRKYSAEIKVESDLGLEHQRRAIAHELGHILLSLEMKGRGLGLPSVGGLEPRVDPSHEAWCRDFEKYLCMLLDRLYTHTTFVHMSKFPSFSRESAENADWLKSVVGA